jgi:hypothetical protein
MRRHTVGRGAVGGGSALADPLAGTGGALADGSALAGALVAIWALGGAEALDTGVVVSSGTYGGLRQTLGGAGVSAHPCQLRPATAEAMNTARRRKMAARLSASSSGSSSRSVDIGPIEAAHLSWDNQNHVHSMPMTLRDTLALGCVWLFPASALAHTVLDDPPALSANDDYKTEPCGCVIGGMPACDDPYATTVYQVGQEITVTWNETVDHAGDFRISFAAKPPSEVLESDFESSPITVTVPDRQAGGLASVTLTLPDVPCDECTIQVRQFMEGAMDPYYYTCASIRIEASGSGGGGAGAGGAPGTGGEPGLGGEDSNGPSNTSTGVAGGEPTAAPPPPTSGCSAARSDARGSLVALAALAALVVRGRRRMSVAIEVG